MKKKKMNVKVGWLILFFVLSLSLTSFGDEHVHGGSGRAEGGPKWDAYRSFSTAEGYKEWANTLLSYRLGLEACNDKKDHPASQWLAIALDDYVGPLGHNTTNSKLNVEGIADQSRIEGYAVLFHRYFKKKQELAEPKGDEKKKDLSADDKVNEAIKEVAKKLEMEPDFECENCDIENPAKGSAIHKAIDALVGGEEKTVCEVKLTPDEPATDKPGGSSDPAAGEPGGGGNRPEATTPREPAAPRPVVPATGSVEEAASRAANQLAGPLKAAMESLVAFVKAGFEAAKKRFDDNAAVQQAQIKAQEERERQRAKIDQAEDRARKDPLANLGELVNALAQREQPQQKQPESGGTPSAASPSDSGGGNKTPETNQGIPPQGQQQNPLASLGGGYPSGGSSSPIAQAIPPSSGLTDRLSRLDLPPATSGSVPQIQADVLSKILSSLAMGAPGLSPFGGVNPLLAGAAGSALQRIPFAGGGPLVPTVARGGARVGVPGLTATDTNSVTSTSTGKAPRTPPPPGII